MVWWTLRCSCHQHRYVFETRIYTMHALVSLIARPYFSVGKKQGLATRDYRKTITHDIDCLHILCGGGRRV